MGYFVPGTVATWRNTDNQALVWWLAGLTSWTVIGWIAALILAAQRKDTHRLANEPTWFGRHYVLPFGAAVYIVGGIIGIAVAGGGGAPSQPVAGVSAAQSGQTGGQESQQNSGQQGPVPLGETAKVGDLAVTVTDVSTQQSIGPEFMGQEARGKYVLVDVEARNTGSDPQGFGNIAMTATDAAGNTYQSDPAGYMLKSNQGSGGFMQRINPGSTATGTMLFDVPEDRDLSTVKIRVGFLDQPRRFALQ